MSRKCFKIFCIVIFCKILSKIAKKIKSETNRKFKKNFEDFWERSGHDFKKNLMKFKEKIKAFKMKFCEKFTKIGEYCEKFLKKMLKILNNFSYSLWNFQFKFKNSKTKI